MQSFKPLSVSNDMYCQSSFFLRGDEMSRSNNNTSRLLDIGELEHPVAFHQQDAVDLSRSSIYGLKANHVAVPSSSHFGALNANMGSSNLGSSAAGVVDAGEVLMEKRTTAAGEAVPAVPVSALAVAGNGGQFENWGESAMADTSQQTDTSTDVDTEDRVQYRGIQHGTIVVDSMDQSRGTANDQKALRRLVQNREAARKSRLRKKAYVQQLETSRLKLAQLEQELERARQQGIFIGTGDQGNPLGNGPQAFDISYSRWLDDHQRLVTDIRTALNSHAPHDDNHLRLLVDDVMIHYSEKYKLKSAGAKNDIFHMLSGMWKTPAERCFMWLGGFRSSELLKILANHLEPLTEQQVMGICNLQQSCQQAEDALSQGMEALQQSLVETLSSTCGSGNVADYMGQMALAMGKLATLENFVHQADLLRQQTLQQMHRILTTRQAARALVVIHDYTTRLRALSSLWLARPKN